MEYKGKHDIYDGPKEGLFGQTDRTTGEYRFRSGNVQQIYSDARYIPADESYIPPRYYRPADTAARRRKKAGFGFFAVLTLCLACAILGGIFGAVLMSGYVNSPEPQQAGNSRGINMSVGSQPDMDSDSADMTSENEIPASSVNVQSSAEEKSVSANAISSVYTPAEIYEMACRQTVVINTEYSYNYGGAQIPSVVSGSGFVIGENGLILTNYHVVEKAVKDGCVPVVTFNDGSSYEAAVIEYQAEQDVALLKIDCGGLEPVVIGDSDEIKVGDTIYVVGDPNGVLKFTQTTGHICALDRMVATETCESGIKMFQIDADVYNGNSGGPVYNDRGEVIGIVTAKYGDGDTGGIGFAIPINDVEDAINSSTADSANGYGQGAIIRHQKAGMGLNFDTLFSDAVRKYYGLPVGAFVSDVEYAGPAYLSGIEPGDMVVEIGGEKIEGCDDVTETLERYSPGDTAEICIWRNGRYYTTNVTFDVVQ